MLQPAIDIEKLNQLSIEVTDLYHKYILMHSTDVNKIEKIRQELTVFLKTSSKARAHASLAGLYFIEGDLTNMEFHYRMAIRFSPNDPRIRYNFASALYHCHKRKDAIEQFSAALVNAGELNVIIDIYKWLERELLLPKCREIIAMIESKYIVEDPEVTRWIEGRKKLLLAYERLNIDTNGLQSLFSEFSKTLRPQFPMSLSVHHYYEEVDDTIYYVFIDRESDTDKAFEHCMALIEFVTDFEIRHNVDFKHFVLDYEGTKQ